MNRKCILTWLLVLGWAAFAGACNAWILRPLAADLSLYGVLAVGLIAILWLTSLPAQHRRKWIVFTIFSLLLSDGLGSIVVQSLSRALVFGALMILGLTVTGWLVSRWKYRYFLGAAVLLLILNLLLPFDDWAFLTHFRVAYRAELPMDPLDLPAPPVQVIDAPGGPAVVTLANVPVDSKPLKEVDTGSDNSPDALEHALHAYHHRYAFVQLIRQNGRFTLQSLPHDRLAYVDPLAFTTSLFPFVRAYWTTMNGDVVQYMVPSQSPHVLANLVHHAAYLPRAITSVGADTVYQEQQNWQSLLTELGVQEASDGFRIENGRLIGRFQSRSVSIPVNAFAVVGMGSFTAAGAHEVLVQGGNNLQVVSLDKERVVANYEGDVQHPLPADVVVGPIDNSGRDVVFVNSSPAVILQPGPGAWTKLYQAPNPSLRFEAAVRFSGDQVPEIICNDPSYLRNTPVRYLTSYRYEHGDLVRNWRVFEQNVVNVHPVQFEPNGPEYLVASIYGAGTFIVLEPHNLPVIPVTGALLGLSLLIGWWLRWSERRGRHA
jgi:hypothetical protein